MSDGTPKVSNGHIEAAISAAVELSKIGSKSKEARQRVARIIKYGREALELYYAERDMITAKWAKRDDTSGEIVTEEIETSQGKGFRAVMRNHIESTLESNALQREPAKFPEGVELPKPFTFDELDEHFTVMKVNKEVPAVSAELAARLGPFCTV